MANTKITVLDRIRALFATDKEEFWFKHFTDEEKELRQMDVWQLAKIIAESRVNQIVGSEEKRIVAEHYLSVRLAKIQARPNYIAVVTGIVCAFGGILLTSTLQKSQECICRDKPEIHLQKQPAQPVRPSTNIPAK